MSNLINVNNYNENHNNFNAKKIKLKLRRYEPSWKLQNDSDQFLFLLEYFIDQYNF